MASVQLRGGVENRSDAKVVCSPISRRSSLIISFGRKANQLLASQDVTRVLEREIVDAEVHPVGMRCQCQVDPVVDEKERSRPLTKRANAASQSQELTVSQRLRAQLDGGHATVQCF